MKNFFNLITFLLFICFLIALGLYLYAFYTPSAQKSEFINDPSVVLYFKKPEFEVGETVEFYVNTASETCKPDKTLDFSIKYANQESVVLTPACSGVIGKTSGRYCRNNQIVEFITTCTDIMQIADKSCTSIKAGQKGEWEQIDFSPNDHFEILNCAGVYFDKPTDGFQVEPGEYTLVLNSPTGAVLQKPFKIIPAKIATQKNTKLQIFLRSIFQDFLKAFNKRLP